MKKLLPLIVTLTLTYSCSEPLTPPEIIANDFYLNLLTGNSEKAFESFSEDSIKNISLYEFEEYYLIDVGGEELVSLKSLKESTVALLVLGYPELEIKNILVDGKKAQIDIEAEVNDSIAIAQKLMAKITEKFINSFSEPEGYELANAAEHIIIDEVTSVDSDALPKKNLSIVRFNLVLQKDGWKIDENLDQIISIEKDKQDLINKQQEADLKILNEKIEKQKLENERLQEEKKRKEKEKLEREQQIEKEKIEYMQDKISIFEFEATRIDTYLDKNIPAVRFAIKNNGDKSLDEVKVTVFFYDRDDMPIYEKSFYPVLVNSYSSSDSPLKPNYIKREKEGSYFTIDELGAEWTGKADIVVSEIEFSSVD